MPLVSNIEDVKDKSIELTLPNGDWDNKPETKERIWIKPIFSYPAQIRAESESVVEVPDGFDKKTKLPKTKRVFKQELYSVNLILSHILKSTIRQKDGKVPEVSPTLLELLGVENCRYLYDRITELSGLPAGGFTMTGPDGKEVSFRGSTRSDSEQRPDDVRPPEHTDDVADVAHNP